MLPSTVYHSDRVVLLLLRHPCGTFLLSLSSDALLFAALREFHDVPGIGDGEGPNALSPK